MNVIITTSLPTWLYISKHNETVMMWCLWSHSVNIKTRTLLILGLLRRRPVKLQSGRQQTFLSPLVMVTQHEVNTASKNTARQGFQPSQVNAFFHSTTLTSVSHLNNRNMSTCCVTTSCRVAVHLTLYGDRNRSTRTHVHFSHTYTCTHLLSHPRCFSCYAGWQNMCQVQECWCGLHPAWHANESVPASIDFSLPSKCAVPACARQGLRCHHMLHPDFECLMTGLLLFPRAAANASANAKRVAGGRRLPNVHFLGLWRHASPQSAVCQISGVPVC